MLSPAQQDAAMTILSIGEDIGHQGKGLPLSDALNRKRYRERRTEIDTKHLVEALRRNPDFIRTWISNSEDKRTSDGWYLLEEERKVGCLSDRSSEMTFKTIEEAVAYYVLQELDCVSDQDAV